MLAISAVGGWLLAGRALRPIDELTRRAQQISAHDLSQRLNLDQDDELGRLAATFDDMIARLDEAFARQKRFTSDASHELRTPLTVMQADLGLALARPRSAEEYRQTLVSMDEEVGRLSSIVNDLLVLTRIDVDPAGMPHDPVALHELLMGLVKRVRAIAAERDVAVSTDRLEPVTVVGDATRLRQLFTNLLENAVTYTQPGGRVTVRLERTRDGARISVSDTGIGIAREDLSRIFERFYRADEARLQNPHGTGLGLAISRSVVQAHRGEITVQSTPGAGTTFTVLLPADGRKRPRRIYSRRALAAGAVSVASSQ
jgi:heavy metal sensor kinase